MRLVMEFQMPAESDDYEAAMNGARYAQVLYEFTRWLEYAVEDTDPPSPIEILRRLHDIRIDILSEGEI